MLAFERRGAGEPLVLLHGTNSSRAVWEPLLAALVVERDVVLVDLPGHGDSRSGSLTPANFALDVAALLDHLGLEAPAVAGHSVGGWTALELARLGRAGAVAALVPAGLWRRRSPRLTDANLLVSWGVGRASRRVAPLMLRSRTVRSLGLRSVSVAPTAVEHGVAVSAASSAASASAFPAHFRATRTQRFRRGDQIPEDVPVRVVWGAGDCIARDGKSRWPDELPAHTQIETWPDCGHMVMWDQPERTLATLLTTTRARDQPSR